METKQDPACARPGPGAVGPALLRRLAQEIGAGRPWWALLTANEYLPAGSPLRLALVRKAQGALAAPCYDRLRSTAADVAAGARLAELGVRARALISALREQEKPSAAAWLPDGRRSHAERCVELGRPRRPGGRQRAVRRRAKHGSLWSL